MKKLLKKSSQVLLAMIMMISMILSNIVAVSASTNINSYPQNDKNVYNGKVTYGGSTVGDFSINGKQAFCMAHPLSTPPTGTSLTSEIYHNSDVQKVLYYGWNGPAQWSGFKSREHGIVVTSLTLSHYYYGDNSSPSTIKSFLDYIKTKTVPDFTVSFSSSQVSAYRSGDIQRTETVTLNSGSNLFGVSVTLQDGVTYVDETSGTRQTGGNVTIKGKTKFHLEAPLNIRLSSWTTGNKTSGYEFSPIVSHPQSSSYQSIGTYEYTHDTSQTTSLTVNWLQLASLEINKTDIYGNLIDGAVFRLWNQDGYDQDITVSQGKIKVDNLTTGIYSLQEKSAPQGFLLDDTIYTVTLNAGDEKKQTVSNQEPVGKITIIKESENKDRIADAHFQVIADGDIRSVAGKVLYHNGDVVDTLVSNQQGEATTKDLPLGNYIVYETQAPQGYLLNTTRYSVSLKYVNQTTPLITTFSTIVNQEPRGSIELQKEIDATLTQQHLGDAYLKDVEFGLYAQETITNAAKTKVYYQKDELILKKITDEKGHIVWSDLPMGNYYIKELSTNDSMILNPQVIKVTLAYQNQETPHINVSVKTKNTIASQRIKIFKEGTKDGQSGVVQGLQGAEFTFVLKSEYEKVGFDKAYKYFVGTTDQNGFLTTSLLPYGTYRVRETKTPHGYYGASDFLITVERDASLYEIGYQLQNIIVNNMPFESLLKIIKKDQDTNKTVQLSGATFKVKNLDTDEYVSYIDWSAFPNIVVSQWTTHEDGSITLNKKLKVGHYQLEEIKAPDGYLLSEDPVPFEITQDNYEISEDDVTPITIVHFKDKAVNGKVTLNKLGEVLIDYQDGKFIYEERGLAHAKFEIYAREDILDPSHDGVVVYKKGELVDTLETNEGGKVTSKELPLGEYECQEVKAPDGYVMNQEKIPFSLTYEGQLQDIVFEKLDIQNKRQKVKVEVSKKDEETKDYVDKAEISLIANRDIYNYDGKVIVNAGTVLETVISKKDGPVNFNLDLPLDLTPEYAIMPLSQMDSKLVGDSNAMYVVKETKQPDGYHTKKVNYYVDAKYDESVEQLTSHYDFYNHITETKINKVDSQTLQNIIGAKLQVIDKESNQVIDEWVSENDGHVIKGLIEGKTYILHEVQAPDGYMLAEDQEFTIQDQEGVQEITFVNALAPVITLGDEPEIITPVQIPIQTSDHTIILSYLLMGVGAIAMIAVLLKKED